MERVYDGGEEVARAALKEENEADGVDEYGERRRPEAG
jgi:hypothetical protein